MAPRAPKKDVKEVVKKAPDIVHIIDTKKSNNVDRLLKQLKHPYSEIASSFISMNKNKLLTIDNFASLRKYLPSESEYKDIDSYTGPHEQLGDTEKFYLAIKHIKLLQYRADLLISNNEMEKDFEKIKPAIQNMKIAIEEVKNSPSLIECLSVILKIGNFMNGGSPKGGAYGFKISSLAKLKDTKSSEKTINLMNYIASIENEGFACFKKLRSELAHVPLVVDCDMDYAKEMIQPYSVLVNKYNLYKKEMSTLMTNDCLPAYAEAFVKKVHPIVKQLENIINDNIKKFNQLRKYFCEETMGSSEFFKIFVDFMNDLDKAEIENQQKEKKADAEGE